MIKAELLKMRPLLATAKMMRVATDLNNMPSPKYRLFMRCTVENGIFKASLYSPDLMRLGNRKASYDVFVDRKARQFITYDRANKKWLKAKMDRLDWFQNSPSWIYYCANVWVSDTDAATIKKYFGDKANGYKGILDFQYEIRKEELDRRHKKETAPWDADMALIPKLPKDWRRWVDKVGIPENYIFYHYQKRGAKTGYCTYCGKEVPIKGRPHHNQEGRCACCGHKITFKAIGRAGCFSTDEHFVYLLQRIADGFTVRTFIARRIYHKEQRQTPTLFCRELERTIYNYDLTCRTYYWGRYKDQTYRWNDYPPTYSWWSPGYYSKDGRGRIYGKTLPALAKRELRVTGLEQWIHAHKMIADPYKYLNIAQKIPQLEQIGKANINRLYEECFSDTGKVASCIKAPHETRLTKALGIDTRQLGRLRALNGGYAILSWLQKEKELNRPISNEFICWFYRNKILTHELDFIWDKMTPVQIYNYLNRQATENRESVRQTLITWQDYLSMAEKQGLDPDDEIIYRARKLKQRHDELAACFVRGSCAETAAEFSQKFPHVESICQSLKKYEYDNGKYAVVAPTGILDIVVESTILQHCIRRNDRYYDRMERHESYLLFLRKSEAPALPYYTIEIEPNGTIRQVRTKYNRHESDFEDVKQFLAIWQAAIAGRLTNDDLIMADKSKKLRQESFNQMREMDIRINNGYLKGRRLVDILTADLMEAA